MRTGRTLRVAVVGVGHHGRHHARICAGLPGASLVAVCDQDPGRAAEAARGTGARAVTRLGDLPADLDAATIAVPAAGHFAAARFFLARGIPVLVEKPVTGSFARAARLADIARRNGTFFFPGFIERFNPAFVAFRKEAARIRSAETVRESPFPFRSLDLGAVMDVMVHDLDLVLSLLPARVVSVEAAGRKSLTAREDAARAFLRFADGAWADLSASRIEAETRRATRFSARDACWTVDYRERTVRSLRKIRSLPAGPVPERSRTMGRFFRSGEDRPSGPEPLEAEIRAFLACVRGARDPAHPTMESTLRVLAVAGRIVRRIWSARGTP